VRHTVRRIARRFKRSLLGYRPSEVNQALAERDAVIHRLGEGIVEVEKRLDQGAALIEEQSAKLVSRQARIDYLEQVADRLAERVVGRERELEQAQEELELLRAESEDRLASFAALAEQLDEIRGQARGQATRIRLQALRDAAELTERISELAKRPAGMRERLLDALEEAIARIGSDEEAPRAHAPVDSNGHLQRTPEELFDGTVLIDIGPLSDFSQLVGFEDAAEAIAATSQISVRRFTQGRATLDLRLAEPVELLRELEERAPFDFKVRDTRSDRLILDVDDE
jgi:ABC-type transporter Mla subunit MlaD